MPPTDGSATWTPWPLVVRATRDGPLAVPPATRAFLAQLAASSVRVLGVLGAPHSGKRLLLAAMLRADPAALTAAANDAGARVLLWVWHATADEPEGSARLVVAVDNGGVDDDADAVRARALVLLLSSTVLYNDDGEIDATALDRLAWLRSLAASLRIKPNQDDDGVARDFHAHAPAFVWVQRNSKVKWLTDPDTGDKWTPTQYLTKCLSEEPGFSDAVAARNEQRMYFHSFFRRCECVALSRALEGAEAASAPLASLSLDQLRAQFVEAVDKQLVVPYLSPRSGQQLPVKTILGRELLASQFGYVVDVYIASMNANALPAIQTAANALLQHAVEEGFVQARDTYEQAMDEAVAAAKDDGLHRPRDVRALTLAHWRGLERALISLQALQAQLPESTKKTLWKNGLDTLHADFAVRLDGLKAENEALSTTLCEELLSKLLPANLEKIAQDLETQTRDSFSDGLLGLLTQYKSDLRDAVSAYREQAAGPALYPALVQALLASVFESIKTYGASVLRQYQHHMREFQEQRAVIEQELEIARAQDTGASFSADDQKRLYEEQIQQSTDQLSELRRVLQGELNAKKAELDRIMSDMTTMDAKHDVRVKNMESDLAWVRSRTEELEKAAMAERQRLEETMTGATEEMLAKERTYHQEERTMFAQQKELLARVVELERELVQKKTKHVQQVFVIESEHAKRVDELKQEQAEFARQLKSQAKTDTGVLKLAYQKKKAVVHADIDRVAREIKEYEEKLKAYESASKPPLAKTPPKAGGTASDSSAAAAPKAEKSTLAVVTALRTSSREFLFKAPDVVDESKDTPQVARSDTEMCKTQ